MRVNAVVTNQGNTLVMELPCSIYEMYEKMQSVGIRVGSSNIHLFDDCEDSVVVLQLVMSKYDGIQVCEII